MTGNRYFNPDGVALPGGNYMHGAEYPPGSRILYTAGQVGARPDGVTPVDFFEQADITWDRIARVVRDAGMTADDIIRINHFLVAPDVMDDPFAELVVPYDDGVAKKYLGGTRPASTLLFVPGLAAPQYRLEVEVVAAAAAGVDDTTETIRCFDPDDVAPPIGAYSQGAVIAAGARLLHTAGQVGAAADGSIPDDFAAQADNAFHNLVGVLAGDGMDPENIAKIRVFLTDMDHLEAYREARTSYLGDARPASTLIEIEALAMPELKIEIEAVGAKLP